MTTYSPKEIAILKCLASRDEPMTARQLSTVLGYSIRSIRTYIKNINSCKEYNIISSQKGYTCYPRPTQLMQSSTIPQNKNERVLLIFKELLIHEKNLFIEDLADSLCITSDTLIREIRKINQTLHDFHIQIKMDKNKIYVEGDEKNKRNAISSFIINDIKQSVFTYHIIERYYPDIDCLAIQHDITTVLQENNVILDGFSIFNIILHIIIVIHRHNDHPPTDKEASYIPYHSLELSKRICHKIENSLHISFSNSDISDFALLLCSRSLQKDENDSLALFLTNHANQDILILLKEIEKELKDTYHFSLDNEHLKLRFYVHMKNLLFRLQHHIKIMNPMIHEIKKHFYIYDVAIFIAGIISKKCKIRLSEDEIAYIAIHLILSFNEEMTQTAPLKVLLICPDYQNLEIYLKNRLQDTFPDLMVAIILHDFPMTLPDHIDIVLAAIKHDQILPYPYLYITPLFTEKDKTSISTILTQKKREYQKKRFKDTLTHFLKPQFFYYDKNENLDWENILKIITQNLYKEGYVPEKFYDMLVQRECLYSSAYDQIAIPHPLEPIAIQSAISIWIAPHGIIWQNQRKIVMIITLALTKKDLSDFKEIFDHITDVLVDDKSLTDLLKIQDYDFFINKLTELCSDK